MTVEAKVPNRSSGDFANARPTMRHVAKPSGNFNQYSWGYSVIAIARENTVIVLPMKSVAVAFVADNPESGCWTATTHTNKKRGQRVRRPPHPRRTSIQPRRGCSLGHHRIVPRERFKPKRLCCKSARWGLCSTGQILTPSGRNSSGLRRGGRESIESGTWWMGSAPVSELYLGIEGARTRTVVLELDGVQ